MKKILYLYPLYQKNNNVPKANTTVLPYTNIYSPKIKHLPVTNMNYKNNEKTRLNNNGQKKHILLPIH